MRIMIFGIPGSGKSTFAVRLAKILQLPVFHLDKYFFKEGWKERDYNEFLEIQQSLVEKDSWIIDGNAAKSFEVRYSRADVVLYFRFNRLLCLWRIFKRLMLKDPHISDRAEGCSERVRFILIKYLWGFEKRVHESVKQLKMRYPNVEFYEIRNDKELEGVFKKLTKQE
jgi:adenylate kinase family enzyme